MQSAQNLKTWMQAHFKLLSIAFILGCLTFPDFKLTYFPGIDGPLPWVFNYFADGHYSSGRSILFPHGPLAFLIYPLPMGNNLVVTIAITLLCSIFFSFSFFKVYFFKHGEKYLIPTLALFLILSFSDIQLILIGITATQLLLHRFSQKECSLVIACLAAILNLYLKTYGGVICLLLLVSYFIYLIGAKKKIKQALLVPFYSLSFFFLVWLILYHTVSGSLTFLIGQMQLSSDNSEAVSFYQVNNWYCISLCILSFLGIPFFTKDSSTRMAHALFILPLFGAWKHAMSRADSIHVNGFLIILFIFCILILVVEKEKKILLSFLCLLSVASFALNMKLTAEYNDYTYNTKIEPQKPFHLYQLLFNYRAVADEKKNITTQMTSSKKLPDTLLRLIGKKTIDVFPWDYSIIAVNQLNWQPRPSLHSYASYTSWLDQKNKEHFLSVNAPQFMLWEINDLGGKLNSIDFRYLLNDAPETMLIFFSSYKLKFKNNAYILFEKLEKQTTVISNKLSSSKMASYNTWIDVPESCPSCITRAKIRIKKSATGFIKSLFYKGESYSLEYLTSDGKRPGHKIVPKNAEDGLWINPLILSPETNHIEPSVKKIRLICWGESSVTNDFEIEFEEVHFQESTPFLERCFNKKDTLQ